MTPNDALAGKDAAPAEREDWLEKVRAIAPAIATAASAIERERRLPRHLIDDLAAAGFFHLLVPRAFGGAEVAPPTFIAILEAIAAIDASTAWCLGQNNVCGTVAAFLEPLTAAEIFGPPARGILAWGAGFAGRATPVAGGYRMSGTWSFASGGHRATWLGGHCRLVDPDGTERPGPDGRPLGRTLLFPAGEATFSDIWHVIGLKGTGSDAYAVENLFVPEAHSVARDDPAERRYPGLLYHYPTNALFAPGFAAVALGAARAMVDALFALAREKTPRGFALPMREDTTVQSELGHMEARLRACRMYLAGTVAEVWHEVCATGGLSLERRMQIRLAATFAIREATAIADAAYNAAGATAIFTSNPFERRLRDMHALAQQVQGRASHFANVGRYLLGIAPDTTFL